MSRSLLRLGARTAIPFRTGTPPTTSLQHVSTTAPRAPLRFGSLLLAPAHRRRVLLQRLRLCPLRRELLNRAVKLDGAAVLHRHPQYLIWWKAMGVAVVVVVVVVSEGQTSGVLYRAGIGVSTMY